VSWSPENFNNALNELREHDARLYLRNRLSFNLPALVLPVSIPIVPPPTHIHALPDTQRGAHGSSRLRFTKRHAQTGVRAKEELSWCGAAFWHGLVEACETSRRRRDSAEGLKKGIRDSGFVSASSCGCGNVVEAQW
jgi:hypothetical protein